MGFFKDIRSMLSAKYEGRYLAHLITLTSKYDQRILFPIIGNKLRKGITSCQTEYSYIEGRRADLLICSDQFESLVEIKAEDGGSNSSINGENENSNAHNVAQLKSYIDWLHDQPVDGRERLLVLLTKYPCVADMKMVLNEVPKILSKKIRLLTFCEYADYLKVLAEGSSENANYINMLFEYFSDEGLVMFDITNEKSDLDAFISFMGMNFLPHQAGLGKLAVQSKVSKGPQIFSHLVQNWQLVSEQFANSCSIKRVPTVRYLPHQEYERPLNSLPTSMVDRRKASRLYKKSGSWTIWSDTVIVEEKLRMEFGIEYGIEKQSKEALINISECPITVNLYAAFRDRKVSFCERKISIPDGLKSVELRSSLSLQYKLRELILELIKDLTKENDLYLELKNEIDLFRSRLTGF